MPREDWPETGVSFSLEKGFLPLPSTGTHGLPRHLVCMCVIILRKGGVYSHHSCDLKKEGDLVVLYQTGRTLPQVVSNSERGGVDSRLHLQRPVNLARTSPPPPAVHLH